MKNNKKSNLKEYILPKISHFTDENGNNVDINAAGVNVELKRDGTHRYYRSFGFAGIIELKPVFKD